MSRTFSSTQDQNQKQPKANYHSYFNNSNQPWMFVSTDLQTELETELLERNSHMMQKIWRRARRAQRLKLNNA